jgi:hypothetical protein
VRPPLPLGGAPGRGRAEGTCGEWGEGTRARAWRPSPQMISIFVFSAQQSPLFLPSSKYVSRRPGPTSRLCPELLVSLKTIPCPKSVLPGLEPWLRALGPMFPRWTARRGAMENRDKEERGMVCTSARGRGVAPAVAAASLFFKRGGRKWQLFSQPELVRGPVGGEGRTEV